MIHSWVDEVSGLFFSFSALSENNKLLGKLNDGLRESTCILKVFPFFSWRKIATLANDACRFDSLCLEIKVFDLNFLNLIILA